MPELPRVSVVLPAYNEEGALGGVMDAVNELGDRYDLEMIVVEGGSKDRTVRVAQEHGATRIISSPVKRGKGADFWTGVLAATGDYIVQIDTDHQFEPSEIPRVVDALKAGADMAIATRFVKNAHLEDRSIRPLNMFGNWLFSWFVTLLTGQRITDCLAGFKGFRKTLIPYLQIRSPHFGYEVELIVRAARAKKKIVEVPVTHHKREKGVTNVHPIKHGAMILGSMLEARFLPLQPSDGVLPGAAKFPAPLIPKEMKPKRHWWQRVHPLAWVFLLVFLLYSPSLVGGKIDFDFDNITEGYAYAHHFSRHPLNHAVARYTNAYHSGTNVSENPVFGVYSWAFTLKPPFLSEFALFHWFVFAGAALFIWAAYVFFRDRGFDAWIAAGLVALVFFSARYQLQALQPLYVFSYFAVPALAVVLGRLAKKFQWRTVILGGLIGGFTLLVSYVGLLILFAVPLAAYAAFLVTELWRKDRAAASPALASAVTARRYLLGLGLMALIGLGLSWWHLGPTLRMAEDTPRGIGLTYEESQEETIRFTDLPRLVLPQWLLWTNAESELYIGLIGLVALIAACYVKERKREDRFWRWTLFFTLFFAWQQSPLSWIANKLPLFRSLRAPSRVLFVAIMAAAYLAGRGIQTYVTDSERLLGTRTMRLVRAFFVALVVVLVGGTLFGAVGGYDLMARQIMAWFDVAYYPRTVGLPLEHYHNVIRGMLADIRMNIDVLASPYTALIAASAVLVWFGLSRRYRPVGVKVIAVLIMLSGAAFALMRNLPMQSLSAATLEAVPESAQFILGQPESGLYRAYTLFYGSSKFRFLDAPLLGRASQADQTDFLRDLMPVNSNMRYGIQSIDGYDNFMTRRTVNLLDEVLSETMTNGNLIAESRLTREEKIALFLERLPIVGMMNVKYILLLYKLDDPRTELVWEGKTTSRQIPFYIYENNTVLPRFYLAKRVTVLPEDETKTLEEILKPGRDFQAETLLECGNCKVPDASGLSSDNLQVVSYAPGKVQLRVTAGQERLLVFNENRIRGWSVTVDGQLAPTYFANYIYQGVIVPAGAHEVRFIYGRP